MSRGAARAVFVDAADASCKVLEQNIALCDMASCSQVIRHDLINMPLPKSLSGFNYVFMDPPYYKQYPDKMLGKPDFLRLLAPGGIIIVEHASKESVTIPLNCLDKYRQKKYSRTTLTFLREAATD